MLKGAQASAPPAETNIQFVDLMTFVNNRLTRVVSPTAVPTGGRRG